MAFNEANFYVGSFGTKPENVEVPLIMNRDPTNRDTNFPIGKRWVNKNNLSEFSLTSLSSTNGIMSAFWTLLGDGSAPANSITTDDGNIIYATNNNWNVLGEKNSSIPVVDTIGDVSTSTIYIEDRTSTTAFVVDPSSSNGQRGTFSTIQSAIDAASSGTTIFIKSGIYTENLTLRDGINLASYVNSSMTPTVTVIGKMTLTAASIGVTISGIAIQTNGDYAISVTGSSTVRLFLIECNIISNDFTAIEMTTSGSGSSIRIMNSWGRTNTNLYNFFDCSGAGSLTFWNVNILDPTPQTIASTFSSSGQLLIKYSIIRFPISLTGTARISGTDSEFNTFATNSTSLTVQSTATGSGLGSYIRGCILLSGNATALIVNNQTSPPATVTLNMMNCNVITTAATTIDGTGTINQCGTCYNSGNPILPSTTLTLSRKPFDPGLLYGNWSGVSPAAGYVGENITSFIQDSSAVSITSGIIKDITSITLTPGVWDVSAILMFTGLDTTTRQNASIGTTSATIPNPSYGNNTISSTFTSTTDEDVGLSIPPYRQLVPAGGGNITMYLIARATYSVGTGKAYGRISATRVC